MFVKSNITYPTYNRTSATNCARIYNDGLSLKTISPSLPAVYTKTLNLDTEDVWNGVLLYWLLEDYHKQGEKVLELPHNASTQAKRLHSAMAERTKRLAGPGREDWNHACDLCCAIDVDEDGTKCTYPSLRF